MKIINILPFCIATPGVLGIANKEGSFASMAWCHSEKLFEETSGSKFWWTEGSDNWIDHRDNFSRPTEDQVKTMLPLNPALHSLALELGLIQNI